MDEYDIQQFVAFLKEEETKSYDQWLDEERATALDFYNGEPFGDEEEGRSQIVTRDVAEVVDYMTVSLLRTMVSGDKVVEFDHSDKGVAESATAAVQQEFMQGQDGYRFLHDWIKAGLLEKVSVAKVTVEEQPPRRFDGTISAEDLARLVSEQAEIVAAEDMGDGTVNVSAIIPQPPRFRDYVSPSEQTVFSGDARDLDDDCVYRGFRLDKSLSELAKMGFQTDGLSDDSTYSNGEQVANARDQNITDFWRQGFNRTGANRKVWYYEEYSTYDLNGDGIAELILSHRVGNQILLREDGSYAIDTIDEQPGVAWCPFPMPGRIVGQSLADKVMDIQRVRSVLMRQGLDNLYQTNAPRMLLNENAIGDTTIDDMLTVRANGIVRWQGSIKPEPLTLPFAAQSAFDVMEVMAGEKESRTGITRLNQGLDADALNKTATGTALMQAQGQQIEEYLARNFAEALARLFLKKYRLMKAFGRSMPVVIDGETQMIDPREWPDDMNVVVRVGLGSGRKDQRLQYRTMLLEIAQAAVQGGSRVFNDTNIYNNVKGIIADANLGNVRDLATDPDTLGEAEEKPDPAMVKAQADSMIAAQKLDQDKVKSEADQMLKAQQMQIDAQLAQQKLDYELQAAREKAALDEQLARDKAIFEANLATQKAQQEYQLAVMQIEMQREIAAKKVEEAELPKNRPGGDLDK
ncbi:portal protein [Sphingobium olei]|uniref:Portal protein n=1 Tax=Sphingobium olei TaxID=420955 RepID=A0ABW3NW63_9SPHN